MRRLIALVAQEHNAAARQMPLQLLGVISRYHNYPGRARLPERCDDALGNGNRANAQHGFELSHARGHPRCYDNGAGLHTAAPFAIPFSPGRTALAEFPGLLYYITGKATCKPKQFDAISQLEYIQVVKDVKRGKLFAAAVTAAGVLVRASAGEVPKAAKARV